MTATVNKQMKNKKAFIKTRTSIRAAYFDRKQQFDQQFRTGKLPIYIYIYGYVGIPPTF